MNSKTITTLGILKMLTKHSFLPVFSGKFKIQDRVYWKGSIAI